MNAKHCLCNFFTLCLIALSGYSNGLPPAENSPQMESSKSSESQSMPSSISSLDSSKFVFSQTICPLNMVVGMSY